MNTSDQIMYAGCWVVLMLYIASTLSVFARRSCIGCALSFLFACILWLDLVLFNVWFFLPAFVYHVQEINIHRNNTFDIFQVIVTSEAARDIYLMVLGSLGSSLAVFNAASMLQTEGRIAMLEYKPGRLSGYFIKSIYRVCDYLDIGNDGLVLLPITKPTYIYEKEYGAWEIESFV
ncbi:hypothetical protein F5Y07DRAFT_117829 [Xylaria sp. FL0933]|nr:hypothetical protein F5Y07DRAFT_117829 [Xylaria sp. FL0933]